MAISKGKKFEEKFKEDFLSLPNTSLDRLYDVMNGYKSISQVCDFIGYHYPNIFYLELKSHLGNTFPLANLTQYDKLKTKVGIPGVRTGVIIWFINHDKVIYCPISEITRMKLDNKKSINIKYLESKEYFMIEIPSTKNRVYLNSDYSILFNLSDNQ